MGNRQSQSYGLYEQKFRNLQSTMLKNVFDCLLSFLVEEFTFEQDGFIGK